MNPAKTLARARLMITFARIVECGSISAAARHMGQDKAAVSRQLKALEDQLGVRLMNRTTRHVSVTDIGQVVYDRASRVLHEVEHAHTEAECFRTSQFGVLTVSASVAFGKLQVIPQLTSFMEKYPKIDVELCLLDRQVDPAEEGFDVLLRICDEPPQNMVAHRLAAIEYAIVIAPSALRKDMRLAEPLDLNGQNCLFYGYKKRQSVWRFNRDGISYSVNITSRSSINSSEALRELALRGQGIAMLPRYAVSTDLQEGRLQEILADYQVEGTMGNTLYALHLPGRFVSPKIRSFIEHLKSSWVSPKDKNTWVIH